jgi:two-component system, LytTR family, response regulator
MRVLIVDDEAPARRRIRHLLTSHPQVQVVGEASDGLEALRFAAELAPEAIFLDIEMPGISGLDVAASLPDPAPAVVFVTAFNRYALPAFDAAALDYLLKPVEPDRLARTLMRLAARAKPAQRPTPTQLLIPDRARTHVVAVADIVWLEAADNYVVVHTARAAPLMRRTLGGLLRDLGDGFVRTHRSAAVALTQVEAVRATEGRDGVIGMRDGTTVPCSRSFRTGLLDRLHQAG